MKTFLLAYAASIVPMLAIDAVWLTATSRRLYRARLGSIMATSPRLAPAAVFYLIYNLGIALLVVVPAVDRSTALWQVLLYGGLLGLVAYGTYDLTNQASLREWSVVITLVDLAWGSLLTGAVGVIAVSLTRLLT